MRVQIVCSTGQISNEGTVIIANISQPEGQDWLIPAQDFCVSFQLLLPGEAR